LLQIRKIATILRRFGRISPVWPEDGRIGGSNAARLSRRLDHIAIGAPRHDAILQSAGSGQVVRKPDADSKQDNCDQKAGNGAAAVVALVGFGLGHKTVIS
jgi:hypothetical protein